MGDRDVVVSFINQNCGLVPSGVKILGFKWSISCPRLSDLGLEIGM